MRTYEQDKIEQRSEQKGVVSRRNERTLKTQSIEDRRQMGTQRSIEEAEADVRETWPERTDNFGPQRPCYQILSELGIKTFLSSGDAPSLGHPHSHYEKI